MGLQLSTRCRRDGAFVCGGGVFSGRLRAMVQTKATVCSPPKDGHGIIWRELVNVFKENEEVCSDIITTMTSWAGRVLSCDYRQKRSLWRVWREAARFRVLWLR